MGLISRPFGPITEKQNKKIKQKNGKRKEALTVPDSCNNESNQSSTTTTTTL
jgi:hypothetical protein